MTITTEQRIARQHSIGGSDAPVIAGLSPWKTPLALWMEKTGAATDDEPTLPMRVGSAVEQVIVDEVQRALNRPVFAMPETLIDGEHRFLTAHIDGALSISPTHLEGVEAKWEAFAGDEWGPAESDLVPPRVYTQCAHYLMVTGWPRWHVGALFGGREFRHYVIERNEEIIKRLRQLEIDFWQAVEARIAPPMSSTFDARLLYPQDDGSTVIATPAIADACERLRETRMRRKHQEEIEDAIAAEIQAYMGEARTLKSAAGLTLATWSTAKPTQRIDLTALRAEAPELAQRFTTTAPGSRRFLLK